MKKYGLIGKTLVHSFSPEVHKRLGDYDYGLYNCETSADIEKLLKDESFGGFNVTIPYKKTLMEFCDRIDADAEAIGAVNTVIRQEDGTIAGYNTDYFGFEYMLKSANIKPKGKKVLVLGKGGASQAVQAVLDKAHARETIIISRNNLEEIRNHFDSEIIINATPVGMYPANGESLVNLDDFKNCCGIVDLVYNPHRTKLIMDGELRSIPVVGGLVMLVAQAVKASELFTGTKFTAPGGVDDKIQEITEEIWKETQNIIYIGMPGSGKTTLGKKKAEELGRKFIDIDQLIEEEVGMTIPQFFDKVGEKRFREIETEILRRVSKEHSLVIATGGGVVKKKINYQIIRQNGHVVWIKRDIDKLATGGRPLSLATPLEELYEERKGAYEFWSDSWEENNEDTCN